MKKAVSIPAGILPKQTQNRPKSFLSETDTKRLAKPFYMSKISKLSFYHFCPKQTQNGLQSRFT